MNRGGERRVSGLLAALSGLSGWSLIIFGFLSLLLSALGIDPPGILIGLALLGHGLFEVRQRHILVAGTDGRVGRRLAGNQMALAASVLLYLGWQAFSIDHAKLAALFDQEPLRSLVQQWPAGAAEQLSRDLPTLIGLAYGLAGLVVLCGCIAMAVWYGRASARA